MQRSVVRREKGREAGMAHVRLWRALALAIAFAAFSATGASAAKPAPPPGSIVLAEGQLPHICTTGDAAETGVYYDSVTRAWASAPNCYARWGNLEATPPQLARPGEAVTITATPNQGSNSGTYAPETKSITWETGGAKAKAGCGNADLTCTIVVPKQASFSWQWLQVHVSMPRTFFVDSPGSNCAGQHLCAGFTTNAWSWIGIPPAICKAKKASASGQAPLATTANNRSPASRTTLDCLAGYFSFSAGVNGGIGWLTEAIAPATIELGPEAPLLFKFGGKALQGIGAVNGVIAASLYTLSKDPPDPAFRKRASAKPAAPDRLVAQGPVGAKLAPPMNALLSRAAAAGALARAVQVSRDRAGGAARAGDRTWERRQMLATAAFARRLATALGRLRTASANAAAAFRQSGLATYEVPIEQIDAFRNSLSGGLPAGLKAELRRSGANGSEVTALTKRLRGTEAGLLRAGLDDAFDDPRVLDAYATNAAFLKAYARRVKQNPSNAQN